MSEFELVLGDCLEVMQGMEDGCVDVVITDPPYNVKKDYGQYKDDLSDSDYLVWCWEWLLEAKRISNNRMAICVPTKYILDYWNMLGKDYRQIVLSFNPAGAIRYGYSNQFSSILSNITPIRKIRNVWNNCQAPALGWFFHENNYGHPGYTSEDVTNRIVRAFALPGDVVADPFMGVGTTGKICHMNKCDFIGIEISKDYFAIAQRRIKEAQTQPLLF